MIMDLRGRDGLSLLIFDPEIAWLASNTANACLTGNEGRPSVSRCPALTDRRNSLVRLKACFRLSLKARPKASPPRVVRSALQRRSPSPARSRLRFSEVRQFEFVPVTELILNAQPHAMTSNLIC